MTTTLKPSYGASVAFTTTGLQSLGNSAGAVAGWQSAVVDNTSDLAMDQIVTFVIKMGTSPGASTTVECWLYEILDDTPTYPDTVTGSEGAVTLTSLNVKYSGAFKLGALITVDNTSSRLYYATCRLTQLFGMSPPKKWGAVVINVTGVALASSGNVVTRTPVQFTSG